MVGSSGTVARPTRGSKTGGARVSKSSEGVAGIGTAVETGGWSEESSEYSLSEVAL